MNVRDNLSSVDKYNELISKKMNYLLEDKEDIQNLILDEKNGVQRYKKPNKDIIKSIKDTILGYQYEILIAMYSKGESIESIAQHYKKTIDDMIGVWRQSNGYVQMVWMLSIGILLGESKDDLNKLEDLVKKDDPKDYLLDFLLNPGMEGITTNNNFKFPVPYKSLQEVINLAHKNRKEDSIKRLKEYLSNEWYKGHSDTGWHDSHKSKQNIHYGYWSFESGALVKILKLDDTILKDQQYYPYDLVHWK